MRSTAIRLLALLLFCAAPALSQTSSKAPLKPHPQANLPKLDLPAFQLSRPPDAIRATYKFAAEHPEVLGYMPCFCSCDKMGHKSNEDCFVKARGKNGDVTAWEDHGMVCAMCLAVGERAMKLYERGVSPDDIRADIEKNYGHVTEFRTPTPTPPAHTHPAPKK